MKRQVGPNGGLSFACTKSAMSLLKDVKIRTLHNMLTNNINKLILLSETDKGLKKPSGVFGIVEQQMAVEH